jgi:hypothetical protein
LLKLDNVTGRDVVSVRWKIEIEDMLKKEFGLVMLRQRLRVVVRPCRKHGKINRTKNALNP